MALDVFFAVITGVFFGEIGKMIFDRYAKNKSTVLLDTLDQRLVDIKKQLDKMPLVAENKPPKDVEEVK